MCLMGSVTWNILSLKETLRKALKLCKSKILTMMDVFALRPKSRKGNGIAAVEENSTFCLFYFYSKDKKG